MSRRSPRPDVIIKRVYVPSEASDGTRVLVDRIWPRGLTKEHATVDVWLKDIAPSAGLRRMGIPGERRTALEHAQLHLATALGAEDRVRTAITLPPAGASTRCR